MSEEREKELKKGTIKSPCCKVQLHFKVWNNIRIREEDVYPSICPQCQQPYKVKAPKN